MIIRCCKDCGKRYVGCHAECKSYQAERRELTAFNEKRFMQAETAAAADKIQWYGATKYRKG